MCGMRERVCRSGSELQARPRHHLYAVNAGQCVLEPALCLRVHSSTIFSEPEQGMAVRDCGSWQEASPASLESLDAAQVAIAPAMSTPSELPHRCKAMLVLHRLGEERSSAAPVGQTGRSSRLPSFDIHDMTALQMPIDSRSPCHTSLPEAKWALGHCCTRACWRCSRCKQRHQITPGDTGKSTFAANSRARSCNAAR